MPFWQWEGSLNADFVPDRVPEMFQVMPWKWKYFEKYCYCGKSETSNRLVLAFRDSA